ncbi:hypothetical protein ACFQ1S_10055 [Kibdelosporangium lantanae]|uniref:Uncharacterized protein n=1 Tax=Kibdelosporangium lantanae TaxID=1497396 RepID=A0ABW3M7A1_9PSEU
MAEDYSSWRWSDAERRSAVSVGIQSVAALVGGPWGLALAFGMEYLYNRRQLIFNSASTPERAYSARGEAVSLGALAQREAAPSVSLYLNPELTAPAQQLGLRSGDPVTLILSDTGATRTGTGLVVPTRVGEQINLVVPRSSYTVAAFGARRDSLFVTPDPFTTIGAATVTPTSGALQIPLTARQTMYTPAYKPLRNRALTPSTQTLACNCPICVPQYCTCATCMAHAYQRLLSPTRLGSWQGRNLDAAAPHHRYRVSKSNWLRSES